jgi:hypothetical protein
VQGAGSALTRKDAVLQVAGWHPDLCLSADRCALRVEWSLRRTVIHPCVAKLGYLPFQSSSFVSIHVP